MHPPNVENEELLIDAAQVFWEQYSSQTWHNDSLKRGLYHCHFHHDKEQRISPPPNRAPLNQLQTQQFISEQEMERDTRLAIEQAIEQYRQQDNDGRNYELISIPILYREEMNENRWGFHRFRPHPLDGHPNHGDNNPRHDVRLAFRRICLAVLTVVAAFLCTMMQDGLWFDDGMVDAENIWFTGLLGPHYQGLASRSGRGVVSNIDLWNEGFVSKEDISRMELLMKGVFEDEEVEELEKEDFGSCHEDSKSCHAMPLNE